MAHQQLREAELRAEENVQKMRAELAELRREKEAADEAAGSRYRLLSAENCQLTERLRRAQEGLEEAAAAAAEAEHDKVLAGKEAARVLAVRADEFRDELAVLRASHQRQVEALQSDLAKEADGRKLAMRRADETAAEGAQHKASLEGLKRSASMEEAHLRAALDEAVREVESTRSSSMDALSQVEERLARALVRAEAAEAELASCRESLDAVQESEQRERVELAQARQLHAREMASKGQTIETLRDALASSEQSAAEERRCLANAREEWRNCKEALQREIDALKSARERADSEVMRVRDGAVVDAESMRKRITVLEGHLEENRSKMVKAASNANILEEENARLTKQMEHLKREQGAVIENLTAQVALM